MGSPWTHGATPCVLSPLATPPSTGAAAHVVHFFRVFVSGSILSTGHTAPQMRIARRSTIQKQVLNMEKRRFQTRRLMVFTNRSDFCASDLWAPSAVIANSSSGKAAALRITAWHRSSPPIRARTRRQSLVRYWSRSRGYNAAAVCSRMPNLTRATIITAPAHSILISLKRHYIVFEFAGPATIRTASRTPFLVFLLLRSTEPLGPPPETN